MSVQVVIAKIDGHLLGTTHQRSYLHRKIRVVLARVAFFGKIV
jgi:hypothetical protein